MWRALAIAPRDGTFFNALNALNGELDACSWRANANPPGYYLGMLADDARLIEPRRWLEWSWQENRFMRSP